MKITPFKLERFFAEYEFKVRYLLSPSDCESLAMSELLDMANDEIRVRWQTLRLGYTESPGLPELRIEISRQYSTITAEQTLVAVPEEAIFLAMHALLRPGDQVIAGFPAYQSLYQIADSLACQVTPWRFEPAPGGWRLDLDWLAGQITPRTRLLVVNFPHNPTGYLPSQDEFATIVNLASQHGVYLFCDEMYRGLEYHSERRLPSAADLYERAISLSGLSKTYALPGLRLGWLAMLDGELLQAILALKDYTTICSSAPSEILGLIALQNRAQIIRRNLDIIQKNLSLVKNFFEKHTEHFAWLPPQAGSVAFPSYRGPGSVVDFCQNALEQCGVMIVPGSIFDYPGEHFRIGLGRRNFGQALGELERLL